MQPHPIHHFLRDAMGAVTVDWVVLTAATVGLGIAVVSQVRDGSFSLATAVSTTLGSVQLGPLSFRDPTYIVQRLTPEQLEQWTATFAAQTNAKLQASAQQRYDQFMSHLAAQQWTQAQTRMDYYHLIQQEMASRGVAPPSDLPTATGLYQTYLDARG